MPKYMRKRRGRPALFYTLVFLMTFIASLCISFYFVRENATSIGFFLKGLSIDRPVNSDESDFSGQADSSSNEESSALSSNDTSAASSNSFSSGSVAAHFGSPVPESSSAEDSFFKKTLFIGDAQAVGLSRSETFPSSKVLADNSLSPSTAFTGNYFPTEDGKISLTDSFKFYNPEQVYLIFGAGDLSSIDPDTYIEEYASLVEEVQARFPGCPILVQGILPVTTAYEKNRPEESNDEITSLNDSIQKMCQKYSLYYLDIPPDLVDSGTLSYNCTTDGKHLNGIGFKVWMDYLRTHTVAS